MAVRVRERLAACQAVSRARLSAELGVDGGALDAELARLRAAGEVEELRPCGSAGAGVGPSLDRVHYRLVRASDAQHASEPEIIVRLPAARLFDHGRIVAERAGRPPRRCGTGPLTHFS